MEQQHDSDVLIDTEIEKGDRTGKRQYRMVVQIDNNLSYPIPFKVVEDEEENMIILQIRMHQEHWDFVKKTFGDYVAEGHPDYTIEEYIYSNYKP